MKLLLIALCLSFLVVAPASAGSLYYYEDEGGTIRFSDEPPEVKTFQVKHDAATEAFRAALTKYSKAELRQLITRFSDQVGIDPALVEAVVKAESSYDPMAVSKKGAQGLMQLMPATARALGVSNAHDPNENLQGGIRHLKRLLTRFNGSVDLAVAAYNAGETAVLKYNGIPPYPETIDYVSKVRKYYARFAELASRSAYFNASTRTSVTQ